MDTWLLCKYSCLSRTSPQTHLSDPTPLYWKVAVFASHLLIDKISILWQDFVKRIPKENRLVWLNCTAHSSLIITPCLALSSLYAVATSLNFWPSFNLAIASITLECFSHKIWRTLWNCDFMWISQLSLNNNNNLYHYNDLYVFLSSACAKDKSEPVHFGSEILIL